MITCDIVKAYNECAHLEIHLDGLYAVIENSICITIDTTTINMTNK